MFFDLVFDKLEPRAELVVQGVGVVTGDVKAAALLRAFWAERRNDHVTAGPHRSRHLAQVRVAMLRLSQEVEHGAVVPEVVVVGVELVGRHVAAQPTDMG